MMGRYRTCIDQDRIAQMLKAGYGQGTGSAYRPWLEVTQVPSRGLVCRVRGNTTGRVHHLLSRMETTYWYPLDWDESVVDIREQFPLLPIEDTLRIAHMLGYRHPAHPKTHRPVVMTTDFLLTMRAADHNVDVARAVKPSGELDRWRICEKLAIERIYWQDRGIDWGLVTEHELAPTLARNLRLVAPYWTIHDRVALSPDTVEQVAAFLTPLVTTNRRALSLLTDQGDAVFGYTPGTCLTIAYHLSAHRRWPIDWQQPIHPQRPIPLLLQPDDTAR